MTNVARAELAGYLNPGFTLEPSHDFLSHSLDSDGRTGTDIQDALTRRSFKHCANRGVDNIVHVNEIPAFFTILENIDCLSASSKVEKDRQNPRVWILQRLAWAVD